ncbi:protein TPX2 isoform X2 [Cynara cardunculus var. scolymus]|uniref:protein TPX2 isoform X2 n=1 Tax=Cynara cardunculus var. scolymus TaxID=59895 RepID=UPI000D62C001|nr:protein TPX2 isoform X2 [Cynara cardunculus var. scolymus]
MEVEMEDDNSSSNTVVEFTFTAVEIDLDYEFEAARFFDFKREESLEEAREAEMWFDSVESYPPSPFAVRLLSRELSENADVASQSKGFDDASQLDGVSDVRAPEDSAMALRNTDGDGVNEGVPLELKSYYLQAFQKQQSTSTIPRGLGFKDSTRNDNYKSKTKPSWKPSFPRTSTLMKPTASQLAKQNQERLVDHFRFQKLGNSSSGIESQAAKRQKLEGGHLCKVTETKQQANFVHKPPKREGTFDGNAGHGRLRITVPRPPDLATAQRAQRIRPKGDIGSEHVASRAPGFRALPLNRKIFEAPSSLHQKRSTPQLPEFQEFHLKTTERAAQNAAAVPSTSACGNNLKVPQKPSFAFAAESSNRESKGISMSTTYCSCDYSTLQKSHVASVSKQEDCETIHRFKALPLNKKIFSSKGDLGVFRSSKRETTVAMTFNFQTEKRAHHAPPVDLFNKLSLASELQQDSGSQLNRPRSRPRPSVFTKGSKENRVCSFQQQSEMKHLSTGKLLRMGSKQVLFDCDKTITEGTPLLTISRNLVIR